MTKQRKVPSGYRIDADKKKWLQENGGITKCIDAALEGDGYFQEQRQLLAKAHIKQKDAIVREAINHAMGRDDWLVEALIDRAEFRVQASSGREWFSFDGKDMIVFEPPESETRVDGDLQQHLAFSQSYRLLYEPVDIGDIKP